jgi:hypothetical protein
MHARPSSRHAARHERPSRSFALLLGCLAACAPGLDDDEPDTDPASDTPTSDADPTATDGDAPWIGEALRCGEAASVGGLGEARRPAPLARYTLDLATFPDARCNDGSPGIFYARPSTNPDSATWVIQLQGGGSCDSAEDCAARWCHDGTAFSMTQMTSTTSPAAIDGEGVLVRGADVPAGASNPLGDAHQVFIKYCSSDLWIGRSTSTIVTGPDPRSGDLTTWQGAFAGAAIIDAVVDTLRGNAGDAPADLPDLDDAAEIVLAGASAGGAGAIHHADRLSALLPDAEVRALVDSTFGPDIVEVGFADSPMCTGPQAICSAEAFLRANEEAQRTLWGAEVDASCLSAHATEPWRCANDTHVAEHHVTTPMFVRQGLSDDLLTDPFVNGGLTRDGSAFTLQSWGALVSQQLADLTSGADTPEEPRAVTPGAFAPRCAKHETLRSTPDTFDVVIRRPNGDARMFDTWSRWISGQVPAFTASTSAGDTTCPGE